MPFHPVLYIGAGDPNSGHQANSMHFPEQGHLPNPIIVHLRKEHEFILKQEFIS